ncbi:MAG: MinD/ParA family protein, partial [Mycobacterium sp.]|nr:MinD/ParA family protein [Mycobacterium sp.]
MSLPQSFRGQGRFRDPAEPRDTAERSAASPAALIEVPGAPEPKVQLPVPVKPAKPRSLDPATVALLSRPSRAPSAGWRKWVYYGSGTLLNLGESRKTLQRNALTAQVSRPLRDCYRIAVLSLKG